MLSESLQFAMKYKWLLWVTVISEWIVPRFDSISILLLTLFDPNWDEAH